MAGWGGGTGHQLFFPVDLPTKVGYLADSTYRLVSCREILSTHTSTHIGLIRKMGASAHLELENVEPPVQEVLRGQ